MTFPGGDGGLSEGPGQGRESGGAFGRTQDDVVGGERLAPPGIAGGLVDACGCAAGRELRFERFLGSEREPLESPGVLFLTFLAFFGRQGVPPGLVAGVVFG